MTITYRINLRVKTAEIDDYGVSFCDGFAVFFDAAHTPHRIPGSDIIRIDQPSRGDTYNAGREG